MELFAEERQIAIVNLSAENKSYVKLGGDDFFTFVSEELPDFVGGMFPIAREPEHTYIAGLSMGGYGTLVHALTHPERFKALGAFSAAVQLNPALLVADAMAAASGQAEVDPSIDPASLAEKLAADGKTFPKAYVACGAKDFLYKANQGFRDKLVGLGADVVLEPGDREVPGLAAPYRLLCPGRQAANLTFGLRQDLGSFSPPNSSPCAQELQVTLAALDPPNSFTFGIIMGPGPLEEPGLFFGCT